jgi:signal transduction histidine kinase
MSLVATISLALAVFALGTAIFNLWIFWMRPREPAHLWLSVASIGAVWLTVGLAASYGARTLAEVQNAHLLAIGGALPLVSGFVRFSELYAGIRHRAFRAAIAVTALGTGLVCADPSFLFEGTAKRIATPFGDSQILADLSIGAKLLYAACSLLISGLLVAYARRSRRIEGGRAITGAFAVWAACMFNDMCVGLGLYWAPWLLPLGFVAFGGTFAVLLLRRLVRSMAQVEHSAGELYGLVEARTAELRRKDLELAHGARLATLGALAGGIAHEVERPLAAIDANMKELRHAFQDAAHPDAFRERLAQTQRNVEHIRSVVAELLQLARREEGHQGLHDLPAVVAAVLPIAGYELRRRARLETHFASTPPVRGDAAMLAQIALNLLVGVIHAFPEAPPLPGARIDLTTEERDGCARLIVCDNVPAPPADAALHLFDASAASEGERERRMQLAVTKQLVERHGGVLEIDGGVHGTRVVVSFPPPAPGAAAPEASAP